MRYVPSASGVVHQGARAHWRRSWCSWNGSGVDELLEAPEPVVVARLRGAVAQQLLRHQQRGGWAGRYLAHGGGALAPRWVQGGSSLALAVDADVVAAAVAAVVLRLLDARLGVTL